MNIRTGVIPYGMAMVLVVGPLATPLPTLSATATLQESCADHFNWKKGTWFPEKAHSGSEIPGEGWTVDSLHFVPSGVNFTAEWHANLEGGYSNQWHPTCEGGGGSET